MFVRALRIGLLHFAQHKSTVIMPLSCQCLLRDDAATTTTAPLWRCTVVLRSHQKTSGEAVGVGGSNCYHTVRAIKGAACDLKRIRPGLWWAFREKLLMALLDVTSHLQNHMSMLCGPTRISTLTNTQCPHKGTKKIVSSLPLYWEIVQLVAEIQFFFYMTANTQQLYTVKKRHVLQHWDGRSSGTEA